ncbi:MAG: hypothetical protein RLY87_2323 [Chloroflexota bacterium]
MSHEIVDINRTTWLERAIGAWGTPIIGCILIPAAFWGLWVGESFGNASESFARAENVTESTQHTVQDGSFIAVTGTIQSNSTLGDLPYLAAGRYVAVQRNVEVFAWEEVSKSTWREEVSGGDATNKTTYTYRQQWTQNPADTKQFREPLGHENPSKIINNSTILADRARMLGYTFTLQGMSLPAGDPIPAQPAQLPDGYVSDENYVYSSMRARTNPVIGDMRISYTVIPYDSKVTIFGIQQGSTIKNERVDGVHVYRMFRGSYATAMEGMRAEYSYAVWLYRALGFLGMFVGIQVLSLPLVSFFDGMRHLGHTMDRIHWGVNATLAGILSISTIVLRTLSDNITVIAASVVLFIVLGAIAARRRT